MKRINEAYCFLNSMRSDFRTGLYYKEDIENLEHILSDYKRVLKENEQLKSDIKNMYDEEVVISIIEDNFNLCRNEVLEMLGSEEEKKAIEELEEFIKGPCETCKYCEAAYKLNRKNIIQLLNLTKKLQKENEELKISNKEIEKDEEILNNIKAYMQENIDRGYHTFVYNELGRDEKCVDVINAIENILSDYKRVLKELEELLEGSE